MKTKLKKAAALLLAIVLAASFLACEATERSAIKKDVIKPFETACRALDVKEMLRCFNPTFSDPILTAMGIADLLGISDYLEKISARFDNFGKLGVTADEFFSSVSIKGNDYQFNETLDKCRVSATVKYRTKNGEKEVSAVLNCVKKDGKWYLNTIGL